LKIGTTSLVLELIERGHAPPIALADPVAATKTISRDETCAWLVPRSDGATIGAVDLQRLYLAAARDYCARDAETDWVLAEWERALDDLAVDPWRCGDRIDWVAKKQLLTLLREAEHLEWDDPWLQSIDLEYHNVSLEHGLFYEMVREGRVQRLVTEEQIKDAIFHPPETTRAFFRGRAVARFNRDIASIQWDELTFQHNGTARTVSLPHPAHDAALARLNEAIRGARTYAEFEAALNQG
jgi:hypothetical protein